MVQVLQHDVALVRLLCEMLVDFYGFNMLQVIFGSYLDCRISLIHDASSAEWLCLLGMPGL